MTDRSSISYISALLKRPETISEGDQHTIDSLSKTYPYFVPVRYISALKKNKQEPFSPQMMSQVQPYLGDWLLFCDFLDAGNKERGRMQDAVADEEDEEMDADVQEAEKVAITAGVPETQAQEAFELIEIIVEDEETAVEPGNVIVIEEITEAATENADEEETEPLIAAVYTEDYFLQQGEKISDEIPDEIDELVAKNDAEDAAKSLMVMMSFSEWLLHFKNTSEKQQEETKDQKALKTMWQKEKLAAAMEEENEEIPEEVFEMAVNSIAKEEGLASETLAEIYIKQGKYDQAIEMYRKLSLRNPQKSTYFARKIDEVLKEKS